LEVTTQPHVVRVTVIDEGPGFDPDRLRTDRETGGWGLKLVDTLSDRWARGSLPTGLVRTRRMTVGADGVSQHP
jgi:hypothetical protein